MIRRLLAASALLSLAGVAPATGIASANQNTVVADCAGLTFDMARGEAGTVVSVTLDGNEVRSTTVANQNDAVRFTLTSPDQTRPHTWVVLIDSRWNTDQRIVRTVDACVTTTNAPTTVPATTTTVPAPTTTAPPVVSSTTTPPQSTTVITTPRPSTPAPATPVVPLLPATGQDMTLPLVLAALTAGTGTVLLLVRRRSVR